MTIIANQPKRLRWRFTAMFFGFGLGFVHKIQSLSYEYQWRAERYRSRKQLLKMDDHLLRDIGISRGDADKEANRGFWD